MDLPITKVHVVRDKGCVMCSGRDYVYVADDDKFEVVPCPKCRHRKFKRPNGQAKLRYSNKPRKYKLMFVPYTKANQVPLELRTSGITWVFNGTGITWLIATKVRVGDWDGE